MKRLFGTTIAVLGLSLAAAHAQGKTMTAGMTDAEGASVGTITFEQTPSNVTRVVVEMTDLPAGPHGFHVHETGRCDADGGFKTAGGHYAGGKDHGVMSENGPHPGDFPNVNADQNGVVKVEFFTDRLSLGDSGDNPLMDDDGSAVVVHAEPDDYTSQPSGDAGDRIACGVIEKE